MDYNPMRSYWLTPLILLLVLSSTIVIAQDSPQVTDVYALVLSSGAGARIFPSPDAGLVAYDSSIRLNSHVDRYLTISRAANGDEPTYIEKPEELPRGFEADAASVYLPFVWSPDSSRLAVTGQPLVTLTDTDLWIFNVTDETWTNLTDDGYSGALTADSGGLPNGGTIIDSQPAWSPDGNKIAVERTVVEENGQFGAPYYVLIDAATGEAHELAPVPSAASTGSTTALDWSPDGSTVAVTLLHGTDEEQDGLWLFNVATGEGRQVVTLTQIVNALHSVLAGLEMTSVGPVVWSPDSTRLLLWAGNTDSTPNQVWPFVVDAESGAITPVPIPPHPRDSETSRGLRPLQAAWSPDSSQLITFTFGLHPDEDTTSLDPATSSVRGGVRILDLESGDSRLLGYLPLGKTPLYYAEWADDGQVIINGYHLTLE